MKNKKANPELGTRSSASKWDVSEQLARQHGTPQEKSLWQSFLYPQFAAAPQS